MVNPVPNASNSSPLPSDPSSISPTHVSNFFPLKLTKDNNLLWKDVLTLVLQHYDMFSFVDGSEPCPPPQLNNQVNPAHSQWLKKDRTCRIWLISSLSEQVLPLTVGSTTTRAVWVTLERRFAAITRSHVLQLKRRIQTLHKGSHSITDYLQQVKAVSDSLAAAGAPLDDTDLVAHILQGLPHEYESFSTSIRVRAEPVLADELHGLLLSHEIDLEQQNTQNHNFLPIPPTQAFVATTSTRPRLNTRGLYSHFRHNPRPRPPPPSAPPRYDPENPTLPLLPTPPFPPNPNLHNRPRPRCQICGLNNHRAPECFHRWNHSYQSRTPPARFSSQRSSSNGSTRKNHSALFTAGLSDPNDESSSLWYLDSGATNHITADLNNLNVHNRYDGSSTVTTANGQGSTGEPIVSSPY